MPTSASKAATAVSQDAGINSAFYLQYFQPSNRWAFARMDADAVLAASSRVLSNAAPTLNTWTHLVGVYNASTLDVYLYVDGSLQGAATDPTPFTSSGPLTIGRARYQSTDYDWFTGKIKDVQVFHKALTPAQIAHLD